MQTKILKNNERKLSRVAQEMPAFSCSRGKESCSLPLWISRNLESAVCLQPAALLFCIELKDCLINNTSKLHEEIICFTSVMYFFKIQEILAAIRKCRNTGDNVNPAPAFFFGSHLCQSGIGIPASGSLRYRLVRFVPHCPALLVTLL